MINEVIRMKKKTEIRMPISLNTHLISKRTNQYTTTIPKNDHAAALTFVNNHTHATTHTNLNTNFMLIPDVRLFFCFVLSFLFSMTFFFMRHPSELAVFVSYWRQKVRDVIKTKIFAQNTLARRERGRFFAKPFRA